jgi:hypothetical protein
MLVICFLLVSSRVYSSTLKMEEIYSSEMSVNFQQTRQCYIPEERTLYIEIFLQLSQYSGQAMGWTKEVGSDPCQRQEILSSSQCEANRSPPSMPRLKTRGAISPLIHISS